MAFFCSSELKLWHLLEIHYLPANKAIISLIILQLMSQVSLSQKVIDNTSKVIEEAQRISNNEKTNKTKAKQSQRVNKPRENITAQENTSKLVTDLNLKERGKSPSMKEKHEIPKHAQKVTETGNSLSASRLQKIQSEKQTIQNELKQLDKQISEIRQEQRSKSILHRREEISNNRQARKIAISLVRNHRARKKQFQEKKKAHDEKTLLFLKQQFQQANKKRQQYDKLAQQERRRVISMRMNEGKKQVEGRRQFQKLSNQLINRLLKEQEMLKQKGIESPIPESQPIVRVVERIPQIDFTEIEKHEQAYLQHKEEHAKKKEGSISVSYPIKKYEKSRWAEKLQEAEQRQKEEEKQKEQEKQLRMDKRLRYGQLIHSLFVKKNKTRTENSLEKANVNSQSILVTPNKQSNARQSIKKGRDSVINSNPNTVLRKQKKQLSPQQIQQKDTRQRQLRKQTVERLRKIESSDIKNLPQCQPKYQSKYQNYLGQIKRKKRDDSEKWSSILNNKEMSRQEKYASMLKQAMALENKAKFKESLHQDSPDEVVDLYLDSIQAKLTLLQNI